MVELNKKFEIAAGVSDLGFSDFIAKIKAMSQAEIDNPTLVPAITNAATTLSLAGGMATKDGERTAHILAAKQITKELKEDRKKATSIVTDDWPPLIKAAIGEDSGKANLLDYTVKWLDGGHSSDEPSIKNSVPMLKPIENRTHLEQEINCVNSKSNKIALPFDVKHINLYEYFGKDAPTSLKDCRYLGLMKRGKFINHFDPEEMDKDVWYIAEYIPKSEENNPELSGAVKSHVV